ncbi:mpv17-like protein [Acipenser ruthenus]|uniref:mpv17-like protein n=1 Tax=Acipenser ruthenus TaxID=7906 RepID=UPI002740B246|nr:mpv17-like protein [Acipenser ruthenus]
MLTAEFVYFLEQLVFSTLAALTSHVVTKQRLNSSNVGYFIYQQKYLERHFLWRDVSMVLKKVLLDQIGEAPLATSVFRRTGLLYWPFVQLLNFLLVPLYLRTAFTGCCAFLWSTFLCF